MMSRNQPVLETVSQSSILRESRIYLRNLEEIFFSKMYMVDKSPIRVALAALIANYLEGDPVWLLLVGPPSSGKTEILKLFFELNDVFEIGSFTEASLLSGSPNREKAKDSTGGLLREMGSFGIIVDKEFTTVLSMRSEKRQECLGALRQVYDGRWTRLHGVDGGKRTFWKGKVGFLGAVTQSIDKYHEVMSSLGERFIMYRMKTDLDSSLTQGRLISSSIGSNDNRIKNLTNLTRTLIDHVCDNLFEPVPPECLSERLVILGTVVAQARSPIEREGYRREIELVHDAEGSPRLIKQLIKMYQAAVLIGCTGQESWKLVYNVGMSSMPELRRNIIELLHIRGVVRTPNICEFLHRPKTMVFRALEDLLYLDIIQRQGNSDNSYCWSLIDQYDAFFDVLSIPIEATEMYVSETTHDPTVLDDANTYGVIRKQEDSGNVTRPVGVKRQKSKRAFDNARNDSGNGQEVV